MDKVYTDPLIRPLSPVYSGHVIYRPPHQAPQPFIQWTQHIDPHPTRPHSPVYSGHDIYRAPHQAPHPFIQWTWHIQTPSSGTTPLYIVDMLYTDPLIRPHTPLYSGHGIYRPPHQTPPLYIVDIAYTDPLIRPHSPANSGHSIYRALHQAPQPCKQWTQHIQTPSLGPTALHIVDIAYANPLIRPHSPIYVYLCICVCMYICMCPCVYVSVLMCVSVQCLTCSHFLQHIICAVCQLVMRSFFVFFSISLYICICVALQEGLLLRIDGVFPLFPGFPYDCCFDCCYDCQGFF